MKCLNIIFTKGDLNGACVLFLVGLYCLFRIRFVNVFIYLFAFLHHQDKDLE